MAQQPTSFPPDAAFQSRIEQLTRFYHANMVRIATLEENKCSMAFDLKESQEALSAARGQVEWLQSQLAEQSHLADVFRNQIISLGAEPEELVLEEEEAEADDDDDDDDDTGLLQVKEEEDEEKTKKLAAEPDPPMARPSKSPRLM